MNISFIDDNAILQQKVASFLEEWNNNSDFFSTKTSGSTGYPKEISIKKEFAEQSCLNTAKKLGLKKGENALLCLDIETIGGKMMVIRALILELNLFVVSPTANPLKNLNTCIDFLAIAPLQLRAILNENPKALRGIKNVIVGGAPISKSLEKELFDEKITVFQTFGMTETISHFALRKVGFETEQHFEVLGSCEVSSEDGRLIVHAPRIGVKHLMTSDLVEIVDKKHFKWVGRSDFVVNSGGIKLHPEIIQLKLETAIKVPFFVTGVDDEKFGQRLIIVFEAEPLEEYNKKEFYAVLDHYETPKEAWYIDKFSYSKSDKISRIETIHRVHESGIRKIL